MINQNSYYKSNDLNNDKIYMLKNFFNPYEYNFESNLKDKKNMDMLCQKTNCHGERSIQKNKK